MIHHDLAGWPVMITVERGVVTLDDQRNFLSEWSRWLDQDGPFATLRLFVDDQALVRSAGGVHETKRRSQENTKRIGAQVLGMANVVPPAHLDRLNRMDTETLFGIPARSFAAIEDALDWLEQTVLRPKAMFDRAAIHTALTASARGSGQV